TRKRAAPSRSRKKRPRTRTKTTIFEECGVRRAECGGFRCLTVVGASLSLALGGCSSEQPATGRATTPRSALRTPHSADDIESREPAPIVIKGSHQAPTAPPPAARDPKVEALERAARDSQGQD